VGVVGAGVDVPLGQGAAQARRILTALALYQPVAPAERHGLAGPRSVGGLEGAPSPPCLTIDLG